MPLAPIASQRNAQSLSYADLTEIFNRPSIPCLTNDVRTSLREIRHTDSSIGLIGWSFRQNGLDYTFRYQTSSNTAKEFDFALELRVPANQPYLHRSNQIGLAEKAHVAAVIQRTIEPFQKQQLAAMFFEFEKACSVDGGVKITVDRQRENLQIHNLTDTPRVHYGLDFPDDGNYRDMPKERIRLIEWLDGRRHFMIDCSNGSPVPSMGFFKQPSTQRSLTKGQAQSAIHHLRIGMGGDRKFFAIANEMNLFGDLERIKTYLPDTFLTLPNPPRP